MAFLELHNVSKTFQKGAGAAVNNFNLNAERGEFISFLGPSGCGKSTTLRMIAGFEATTTGTITIDGNDMTPVPPNKRNVGMVFQSYALFPNLTVAGNIGFGMMVAGKPKSEIRSRVNEMLDLIHLPGYGPRYPYQLSGGQQQRVALARAIALRPSLLLLDEPLSALDAKIRVELRAEIRRIQQQLGITTIYVTHDQEEALAMSTQIAVIDRGRVVQQGKPREIYEQPADDFVRGVHEHPLLLDLARLGHVCRHASYPIGGGARPDHSRKIAGIQQFTGCDKGRQGREFRGRESLPPSQVCLLPPAPQPQGHAPKREKSRHRT